MPNFKRIIARKITILLYQLKTNNEIQICMHITTADIQAHILYIHYILTITTGHPHYTSHTVYNVQLTTLKTSD